MNWNTVVVATIGCQCLTGFLAHIEQVHLAVIGIGNRGT